jgi:hypothetical protein
MAINSFPAFCEFLPELQREIVSKLDPPTASSMSWTCTRSYPGHKNFDRERFGPLERYLDPDDFAIRCAELGYGDLLVYGAAQNAFDNLGRSKVSNAAALHGHLELLQMCVQKRTDLDTCWSLAYLAAEGGHQNILDWLKGHVESGQLSKPIADGAAQGGHVVLCLQHWGERMYNFKVYMDYRNSVNNLIDIFVMCKHLDAAYQFWMATTLYPHPLSEREFYERVLYSANEGSDTIEWVKERCPDLDIFNTEHYTVFDCFTMGSVSLLKLMVEKGTQLEPQNFMDLLNNRWVLDGKAFEFLKYFHETFNFSLNGISFPFDCQKMPRWATKESVQWMKDHQYRFPKETMLDDYLKQIAFWESSYYRGGKIFPWDRELMAWMISEGAPITLETLELATRTCNLELLDLLLEKKPEAWLPDYPLLSDFLSKVFIGRHLKLIPIKRTAQWLQSKGYACDAVHAASFINRVKDRNPDKLELLSFFVQDLGLPYDIELLKQK